MAHSPIGNISADQMIKQGYRLPELTVFNNEIKPILHRVQDAINNPMVNIFGDAESTFSFYSDLKALWFLAVSNLAEGLICKKAGTGVMVVNHKEKYCLRDVFTMVIKEGIHLEPTTKFFLEEMHNIIFRNRQGDLTRYYYILSKPIKDYNIGRQGLELNLSEVHPLFKKKEDYTVPRFEFNTALQQLGLSKLVDAIRIMLAISINLMYINNKALLNSAIRITNA